MAFRNKVVQQDVVTTESYLPKVIETKPCATHGALTFEPCFEFQGSDNDTWHRGICNARAKAAGMNGTIHPTSLDRTIVKQYHR